MLRLHARARSWPLQACLCCVCVHTEATQGTPASLSLLSAGVIKFTNYLREQRSNQHFGMRNMPQNPPGSTLVVIETNENCSNEACCGRKWDLSLPMPAFVGMSDGEWNEFVHEMDTLVRSYKPEGIAAFGILGVFVSMGLFHPSFGPIARSQNMEVGTSLLLLMVFTFGSVLFTILGSTHLRKLNMAVDESIIQLCRRHSNAHATFQFQTLFTGICKPKGTRTYRALCISPAGAFSSQMATGSMASMMGSVAQGVPVAAATAVASAPETHPMQVTCPSNAKEGDVITGTARRSISCLFLPRRSRMHSPVAVRLSSLCVCAPCATAPTRSDVTLRAGDASDRASNHRAGTALHRADALNARGAGVVPACLIHAIDILFEFYDACGSDLLSPSTWRRLRVVLSRSIELLLRS